MSQRVSVGVCVALALCTVQCLGPMSVGTVDGEWVDLSVVSAEWFAVDGIPAGRLLLSSQSDCPGSPPPSAPSAMIDGLTGGPGTYAVVVSLRLASNGGGPVQLVQGTGSVQLSVFGPTRATGSYDIVFTGGAHFGAPFDVPVCGADAGP